MDKRELNAVISRFEPDDKLKEKIERRIFDIEHVKSKPRSLIKRIAAIPVCAAVIAVMIIIVPSEKNYVYAAFRHIRETFFAADGTSVEIERNEDETAFIIEENIAGGYTAAENGRLYFVLDGKMTDITDRCSETEYFRYEAVNADGSRSVILIGGTAEANGWIELMFDSDGKYINNRMSLASGTVENQPWTDLSMHNEGVPTGNPYYDFEKNDN